MSENRLASFDMLRLILASIVVVAHVMELQNPDAHLFLSVTAVDTFFCLAGYFCFTSYRSCVRDGSGLRGYVIKRFFRVYPAYAVVVIVPALLWTAAHHDVSNAGRYLAANLSTLNFLHPCIGTLFSDQPYCSVNGSLWTIKNEIVLYASIPLFFWLLTETRSSLKTYAAMTVFMLASVYYFGLHFAGRETLARQFPSGVAFFLAGSIMAWGSLKPRWLTKIEHSSILTTTALLIVFGAVYLDPMMSMLPVVGPLSLAWAAVRIGSLPLPITPRRDLSYTLYLCHFPVIQLFLSHSRSLSAWQAIAAVAVSVICAYLLTLAAELPGMRVGKRLSRAIRSRPDTARLPPAST